MKPELVTAYMDIAERFAQVSQCERLKVGAIIVKNGSILVVLDPTRSSIILTKRPFYET